MIYQTISVSLANHAYPIYVGYDLLSHADVLSSHIQGHQVLIVTQKNIADYYLSPLINLLHDYQCDVCYLPEGEPFKNLQEWQKIFDQLLQQKHERSTTLIALGGGVVGDMTGFAAACYLRGVSYIQIPTSLIAQVDSAIGGKTGVNHPLGKNMLGAFHQPQCVISDISVLATLPQREFVSGLAEVIKYGLIMDKDFFTWLENNIAAILQRDRQALLEIITHCSAIKSKIVQHDEKDNGLRNLLNFGHTFGHALETMLAYQGILHGEAVAVGMAMAAELSAELGLITNNDVERVTQLLTACDLVRRIEKSLSLTDFLTLLTRDKKVLNQQQNFIVLRQIGEAVKMSGIAEQQIVNAINRAVGYTFCG